MNFGDSETALEETNRTRAMDFLLFMCEKYQITKGPSGSTSAFGNNVSP
jgi:hypothetical protein